MKSFATLNPVPFELLAITMRKHTACTSEARGKAWPDRKLGVGFSIKGSSELAVCIPT